MALSDCSKCWETPCRCGANYGHLSDVELKELIEKLQLTLHNRQLHEQPTEK